jgi:RNA polymerase primary sigma factor
MQRFSGLSRQEEYRLITVYQQGKQETAEPGALPPHSRAARDELVEAHQPLVKKMAAAYVKKHRGYVEYDDLVSAGNEGLLVALDRFDTCKQWRFNTYARCWVANKIRLWIRQERWQFRIPDHAYKNALKILRVIRLIRSERVRVTAEEIAARTNIHELTIHRIFGWIDQQFISLDIPVGDEGKSTLVDCLEDRWIGRPSDAVEDSKCRMTVSRILETLSPKEEKVIRLRFGIGCKGEHSPAQIAQEFGVRTRRVQEIERHALRRLREPARATELFPLIRALLPYIDIRAEQREEPK